MRCVIGVIIALSEVVVEEVDGAVVDAASLQPPRVRGWGWLGGGLGSLSDWVNNNMKMTSPLLQSRVL